MKKDRYAFTLAEMMVVMLILTIVLAAFAPLMTKRKNVDLTSSPWRYTENNNGDIYYGLGSKNTAMIGQSSKNTSDPDSRLIIKTDNDDQAHISFKNHAGHVADLSIFRMPSALTPIGSMRLGGPYQNTDIGESNTAFGMFALKALSNGDNNTAIGAESLAANTSGSGNVAVGSQALIRNTTASNNIAIGGALVSNTTGSNNVAISGEDVLSYNSTGSGNIAIGNKAIYNNQSGNYNVGVGVNALTKSKGTNNTAIGYNACANEISHSNITCIGANSGPKSDNGLRLDSSAGYSTTYIGTEDGIVVIPGMLYVEGALVVNNTMSIGRRDESSVALNLPGRATAHTIRFGDSAVKENSTSAIDDIRGFITSDERLKNVKSENKVGLEEIRKLKVFDYTFKQDKEKTPQVGVIAQDLQKIFPDAVLKGDDGYLKIRWDDMFYAVINSVKQLDIIVQGLINDIKKLLTNVSEHDNEIKKLRKENEELKTRLEKLEKAVF